MKANYFGKKIIVIAALLGVLVPLLGKAGPMGTADPLVDKNCVNLPLPTFLEAQGTSSLFFPPVRDYVGWNDGAFTTFALVDYAGLANQYLKVQKGISLGTAVRGSVIQCALAEGSGRAKITVALTTTRALGFAQSIQALRKNKFDFLNTPTIFGVKAQDVVNVADAALGSATLSTTFFITQGAALPDLVDVLVNNSANYAPVTLSFTSATVGKCSDGREARLDVHQLASTNDKGTLIFSEESVAAVDTNGKNCGD